MRNKIKNIYNHKNEKKCNSKIIENKNQGKNFKNCNLIKNDLKDESSKNDVNIKNNEKDDSNKIGLIKSIPLKLSNSCLFLANISK